MKRSLRVGACVGVAVVAAAASLAQVPTTPRRTLIRASTMTVVAQQIGRLSTMYTPQEMQRGVYLGSEMCLACHQDAEYQAWRDTKHAVTIRKPMVEYSLQVGRGVTADYDHNGVDDFIQGLDFNQISSLYDPYKPNAPKLSVRGGQYLITIGPVEYPVVFISGGTGEWRERYGVRIPAADSPTGFSDDVYFPPVQFNGSTQAYQPYKPEMWWGADKQPLVVPGMARTQIAGVAKASFSKNCIGCHITGIRSLGKTAQGEWTVKPYIAILYRTSDPAYLDYDNDGNPDLLGIGCEMCHGPGSNHVLAGGDPAKIVNPAKLTQDQANEVCGRCHNRVRSVPGGTFAWPYQDATNTEWRPGSEPLANDYTNANVMWPDKETSYEHNQHYSELNRSAHETNPYEKLRCFDCHNAHARVNAAQVRTSLTVAGVTIPTRNEDNTLCLACHATHGSFASITQDMVVHADSNRAAIAAAVSAHSNHPYGPERTMELSRCTTCHMAAVAGTERESVIHSHTFFVVPPEKTLIYQSKGGMPNSCAVSCHNNLVNVFGLGLDPSPGAWNNPFDVQNATVLMKYFGPQGVWWVKTVPQS